MQIILNCLRLQPLEEVLPAARAAGVGIIARVPLASGLLSGSYDEHTCSRRRTTGPTTATAKRSSRRDVLGRALRGRPRGRSRARGVVPPGMAMAAFALRWITDQPGVSVVIPGARNAGAGARERRRAELARSDGGAARRRGEIYDRLVAPHVHDRW